MTKSRGLRRYGRHGKARRGEQTPEFKVWCQMHTRCRNPKNPQWRNYGGRGIRVCASWAEFTAFLSDMGERPSVRHSLDRIDQNGNYEPGNCRWATWGEQQRNRRNNNMITWRGETLCLTDWAKRLGISRTGLFNRLYRAGLSVEEAFTVPMHARRSRCA